MFWTEMRGFLITNYRFSWNAPKTNAVQVEQFVLRSLPFINYWKPQFICLWCIIYQRFYWIMFIKFLFSSVHWRLLLMSNIKHQKNFIQWTVWWEMKSFQQYIVKSLIQNQLQLQWICKNFDRFELWLPISIWSLDIGNCPLANKINYPGF